MPPKKKNNGRHRKQRLRNDLNNVKPLNVSSVEMEVGESSLVNNDDNVTSPAKAHSSEKTTNQQEIALSSEPNVLVLSSRKQLHAEKKEATRIDGLKNQQFYHSGTFQPMSSEEVLAGKDSEDEADEETADLEERARFDQIKDVSEEEKQYMSLWNIFVRKQRVVADEDMPRACEEFTKLHKKELMSSSTFVWWWRAFMFNLWNYALICPKTIDNCNAFLRESEAEAVPSTTQAAVIGNEQQNMEVDEEQ